VKQAHRLAFGCGIALLEEAGGRACGTREAAASLASHCTSSDRVRVLAGLQSQRLALFDAEVSLTYGELDRAVDSAARAGIQASGPTRKPSCS